MPSAVESASGGRTHNAFTATDPDAPAIDLTEDSAIITAVAIDKSRPGAVASADFACFTGVRDFIIGYGMDDAGKHRGLPYIAKAI